MSKSINDGGPAFPVPSVGTGDTRDGMTTGSDGMTLRDWFAGMAMQGDMAAQSVDTGEWNEAHYPVLAKRAYEIADAMLAARRLDKP